MKILKVEFEYPDSPLSQNQGLTDHEVYTQVEELLKRLGLQVHIITVRDKRGRGNE